MKYVLSDIGLKLSDAQLNSLGFNNGAKHYEIDKDFELVFLYQEPYLEIKAVDKVLNEEYMPFDIDNNRGGVSSNLHEEADKIIKRLIDESNKESLSKEELFAYLEKTFSCRGDYPFGDYHSVAFRNEYKKWFVLYMTVKAKYIYKNKNEDLIEVINIKLPEKELNDSIKRGIAHPAFHMNKKYWVSIVLNEVKLDDIKELLMLSYVESGKKGYN